MPERFHQRLAVVRGIKLQRDAAFLLPALEFNAAAQRVAERFFRLADVIHDRRLLLFLFRLFRLTEQDLLALFERHGYDLVLLEGFKDSGWPKIEVVRKEISDTPVSFQPLAVVGDIPGADFGLEDAQALADWLVAQMPGL